ncbi:scavenger receptor cysteine-rich type 1 protein M130-like [Apteryx mantelli]|uniref:Scavenger receptor cysteine-rich type 1 protein M130-like n=1 Tax=Apteryx mantelli TaxID=2696672 RepID=A0ABM4FMG1_9AVES
MWDVGFRLVNGSTACSGRVEMQVQGTWGTLCDSRWDVSDAHVLCHQLNCGFAESVPGGGHFGRGTGPVWRERFHCEGTESHLGQCPVTVLGASQCSQDNDAGVFCSGKEAHLTLCNISLPEAAPAGIAEDVGVVCSGSRQVRLVNRIGRCAGRVEIYYQGTWGTICNDSWDLSDATVVCHQLDCGVAVEVVGSARYGEGSGQIWLDDVNCSGDEAALWDCPAATWGQHNCPHKKDAGVVCSEFVALRLENSDGCSGRLQVFYNGTWGSVCSNSMTLATVSLVCKELGCGDEGSFERVQQYGNVSGPTWLDRVECGKRNSSFWQCPSSPWNPQSCNDQQEETHITCNDLPRGLEKDSRRISVPVIICIILGALLCLILALLVGQVRSARAQRRGSRRSLESFSEAVYQEIDYSLTWEKQAKFGRSGWSLHSRGSDRAPGARRATPSLPSTDTDYDDAEEAALAHPHEDTKAERQGPGAKRSLSPGPGEPTPAVQLGAPGTEERPVQLGEP